MTGLNSSIQVLKCDVCTHSEIMEANLCENPMSFEHGNCTQIPVL